MSLMYICRIFISELYPTLPFLFKKYFIYFWIEGKGRTKRGREISTCDCLLCTLYWGPGPQTRHVPWLGIKPATLWFVGQHSVHWATPARTHSFFLKKETNKQTKTSPAMLHTGCSTKFNLLCWPFDGLYHTCVTCVFKWPPLLCSFLWLVNSYPTFKSHLECHQSFVMSFLDMPLVSTTIIIHSLLTCSYILNIPPVQWLSHWIVEVSLQSRFIYKMCLFC